MTDHSRHQFCESHLVEDRLFLEDRIPFRYQAYADNRIHLVKLGDTLWTLAGHYFRPFERPAGLWWVIADFQPVPIHDPTLQLMVGTLIVIPTLRIVQTEILNERSQENVP